MPSPEQCFADLLAAAPSKPFVTYYDEASGERTELSVRSLANWVAKTHYLIVDELGLSVGSSAFAALPAHWVSVPALLGCLTAGLSLDDAAEADVAFVSPATIAAASGVPDAFAVAPDSAAVGFGAHVPAGASDYVSAVRPQADAWSGVRFAAGDDDPCLDGRSRSQTVAWARERAAELGMADGARVLSAREWAEPSDWIDTLLAPLVVGGSVVYVRNCTDGAVLARRAQQERASVTL